MAWLYVMWYTTVDTVSHRTTSLLFVKTGALKCLIRFWWVNLCCGSFWISRVWSSLLVLSQFLIQRLRWTDLKWCGDDTDINLTATVGEADPEYWCSLFRTVKLWPWLSSSALLLLGGDQISKENRAQSMGRNEKGEQQSSVKPRCHLMPGIPAMVFLTCRPLCPKETHAWSPDELSSLHFTLLHWGEIEQMKFSLWYGLCDKYCMKRICTSTSMYCMWSRSQVQEHVPDKEQMLSAL